MNKIARRAFVKRTAGTLAFLGARSVRSAFASDRRLESERRKAAHRRRRIIFNNDGDDVWMAKEPTTDAFLATRIKPCVDTQVDTVFYCTTSDIGYYLHRSRIAELFTAANPGIAVSQKVRLVESLAKQGTDVLEVSIKYLHEQDKEVFWSHRMNGMEDMIADFLLGRFKRDHPQWWLGKAGDDQKYSVGDHRHWYRVLDYGVAEVRQFVLSIIEEVITTYDIDGVELDYLRDPWLFKETFSDPIQPVTPEHCQIMVEFHRKVRAMLDARSARVGRPLLLALRVPKWVEISRRLGLDIEANLKSGAVDMLIGSGGYTPFAMPPLEFIDLAHRYEVPAYVCISASGMRSRMKDSLRGDLVAWRGAAVNLWDAGVDGQYIFNTMPNDGDLPMQVMREIGDPKTMVGKELLFSLDSREPLATTGWCNLAINREELLPLALTGGPELRKCQFYLGVDPAGLGNRALNLRVYLRGVAGADEVSLILNGRPLTGGTVSADCTVCTVSPGQLRYRMNELAGTIKRRSGSATAAGEIVHFELLVKA